LIEWPEKLGQSLPKSYYQIAFSIPRGTCILHDEYKRKAQETENEMDQYESNRLITLEVFGFLLPFQSELWQIPLE